MRIIDSLKRTARALAPGAPSMKQLNRPHAAARDGQLSPAVAAVFDAIPVNDFLGDRWDREWLHYFLHENPKPFLIGQQYLKRIDSVAGKSPDAVYATQLVAVTGSADMSSLGSLAVWVPGDDLNNRHVLEIGCGPGFLGKQLGLVAASYIGIDYSQLALAIARLTAPANCVFHHLSDAAAIGAHAGTIDTMVGRNFFIHQNYQNLLWLLKLAALLLKPGGLIAADFYLRNPSMETGVVHDAHADLDRLYASCAFEFSVADIESAAAAGGFAVETLFDRLDMQRRFVFFRKPR
jgi:SAM-dependent methyltransferase